ncbi:hypothetical protein SAMN05216327_110133 [Dyadobacter sp. SG02]|nr:hypothetical protein SAMN05216327_110133 [Dyadobacter sp. SG02]
MEKGGGSKKKGKGLKVFDLQTLFLFLMVGCALVDLLYDGLQDRALLAITDIG